MKQLTPFIIGVLISISAYTQSQEKKFNNQATQIKKETVLPKAYEEVGLVNLSSYLKINQEDYKRIVLGNYDEYRDLQKRTKIKIANGGPEIELFSITEMESMGHQVNSHIKSEKQNRDYSNVTTELIPEVNVCFGCKKLVYPEELEKMVNGNNQY
jgi:hypothetical protein